MKIRKLRSIRLVLIVIAVILSLAILGVRILWMPSAAAPEEPVQETNGVNAVQPTETVPAPTQATEMPTEAPTEAMPETEPEEIPQTEPPEDPTAEPEEGSGAEPEDGSDEDTKPSLPFPNPNGSGDGQKEGSLENSLEDGQSTGENSVPADPPQQDSGIQTVSETRSAQNQSTVETEPAAETQSQTDSDDKQIKSSRQEHGAATVVFYILCGLLVIDLGAIVVVSIMIRKEKDNQDDGMAEKTVRMSPQPSAPMQAPGQIRVGQLHNIGARPYQEDSSGVSELDDGILAIVADGMGGLSGGDRVSQKIVYSMLGYGDQLRPGYLDGALERMVYATNEAVNAMLGPEGLYKSGSTLLAVLVRQNRFHWIAVGDSHIYYYHNGRLVQLNEEHNRGQELLHMAARGEITYEEARNAPKKNGLTSFIGMGRLKYIDKSLESIPLVPGDRILLMTDGVFNALSDQTMEAVLQKFPDVQEAAAEMERLVIQKASPRQDNFTAVILGF